MGSKAPYQLLSCDHSKAHFLKRYLFSSSALLSLKRTATKSTSGYGLGTYNTEAEVKSLESPVDHGLLSCNVRMK
jgi:hypothetical protein